MRLWNRLRGVGHSAGGEQYFECLPMHGGFVRPNLVTPDYNWKPPPKVAMTRNAAELQEEKQQQEHTASGAGGRRKSVSAVTMKKQQHAMDEDKKQAAETTQQNLKAEVDERLEQMGNNLEDILQRLDEQAAEAQKQAKTKRARAAGMGRG